MAKMMILYCAALSVLVQGALAGVTGAALPSGVNNPCTPSAIQNGQFHFAYPGDDTKFIQCDEDGNAFVLSCRPNTLWSLNNTACSHPDPTPNTVCQTVGQLVADDCNHNDFFQCNKLLQPVRFSCSAGLFFNPAGFCDTTDRNTETC